MRRDSFLVTDDGSTPDRPLVACLYCSAPVDTEHEAGCVMRRRTIVLRATLEYVVRVPEHWTPEHTDFHFNDGTWCADNIAEQHLEPHLGSSLEDCDRPRCLCDCSRFEFVREATEADEARSALKVAGFVD